MSLYTIYVLTSARAFYRVHHAESLTDPKTLFLEHIQMQSSKIQVRRIQERMVAWASCKPSTNDQRHGRFDDIPEY
jgi:hypothetical protein